LAGGFFDVVWDAGKVCCWGCISAWYIVSPSATMIACCCSFSSIAGSPMFFSLHHLFDAWKCSRKWQTYISIPRRSQTHNSYSFVALPAPCPTETRLHPRPSLEPVPIPLYQLSLVSLISLSPSLFYQSLTQSRQFSYIPAQPQNPPQPTSSAAQDPNASDDFQSAHNDPEPVSSQAHVLVVIRGPGE
jgi:hypothetical protein